MQTELLQCSRETRRYVLELVESHASLLDACKALVTMRDGAMAAIRKAVEKAEEERRATCRRNLNRSTGMYRLSNYLRDVLSRL